MWERLSSATRGVDELVTRGALGDVDGAQDPVHRPRPEGGQDEMLVVAGIEGGGGGESRGGGRQ